MKKVISNNVLAGTRVGALVAGLFVVLIVSIVMLFANFAYINTQTNHDTESVSYTHLTLPTTPYV